MTILGNIIFDTGNDERGNKFAVDDSKVELQFAAALHS